MSLVANDGKKQSFKRKLSLEKSFEVRTLKSESCWEWTGSKDQYGYGRIRFNKVNMLAHRISFKIHKGEIPENLVIDHICRNRGCVNPEHLRAVTKSINSKENTASFTALNLLKTACPHGHKYTGNNLLVSGKKRYCRTCSRGRSLKYYFKTGRQNRINRQIAHV